MNDNNEKKIAKANIHQGVKRMYVSIDEQAVISKFCGDSAVLLYEFYLSKFYVKHYRITDKKTAKVFGWKESKVRTHRLRLKKHGWIDSTSTAGIGYKSNVWFFGELRVASFHVERDHPDLNEAIAIINGFQMRYTDNVKVLTLLEWLKGGHIKLYPFEQEAFDSNSFNFISESTGWTYTSRKR